MRKVKSGEVKSLPAGKSHIAVFSWILVPVHLTPNIFLLKATLLPLSEAWLAHQLCSLSQACFSAYQGRVMTRVAQLTSQLASVVTCEAHNPVSLNGDCQRRAGQVRQGRQGDHGCIAGHLQKEDKGRLEPWNGLAQPIVLHRVIHLTPRGTSKWTQKTFQRKRCNVSMEPNIIVLILIIFFFLPHQHQIRC